MHHIQPVTLCEGSGTRLRPLSRAGFPKQFLCLTGTESLYRQVAKRLMSLTFKGNYSDIRYTWVIDVARELREYNRGLWWPGVATRSSIFTGERQELFMAEGMF